MTIQEKIKQMLVAHGFLNAQADQVIEEMKSGKDLESMGRKWTDQVSDYPPSFMPTLWLNAKAHALEWIDENLPQAWFRPEFAK